MLQLGDKVKFLNEEGGGLVKRFISKTIVAVEVEDGFEIPVPLNQLVVLNDEKEENKPAQQEETFLKEATVNKKPEGKEGVFLAFIPDAVFPANFNIEIINNSQYNILFSLCFRQKNIDLGLKAGLINSVSSIGVYSLSKKELESWSDVHVQLIFHKSGNFSPISGVQKTFPLKTNQFNALQLLKKVPLLDLNAYLLVLADTHEIKPFSKEMVEHSFHAKALKDQLYSPKAVRDRAENFRINSRNGYAEIDLHIEELLDNYSGLSNAQIVEIQLKHCRKAIENTLASGGGKLTIIHGVGNGTLKKEIRNLLQGYDGFRFYDAPYEKYGYGATEVLLK